MPWLLPTAYFVAEDAEPPGPVLEAADPPLVPPPLLEEAPPGDDMAPPPELLLVPPVAELPVSVELELEEPGELGVVLDEDEDDPPGTTTVSFVELDDDDPLGAAVPPGTTVVVSLRSHPLRARAPNNTNRYPLHFMSTLLSSDVRCKMQHRLSKQHARLALRFP